MSFTLFYFLLVTACITAYALGYRHGNRDGNTCGFDEGYDFATSDSEVTWRLTAKGSAALAAEARESLAELHVHPIFLDPRRHELPFAEFPGTYFDHETRTFKKP